jgi:hypothetical protein
MLGVDPGVVGAAVEPPPPHRDAETAAANTAMRINEDRMLLYLQEAEGPVPALSKRDTNATSCRINRPRPGELPAA